MIYTAPLSRWVVLCLLVVMSEKANAQLSTFGRDFYCAYLKPGLKCPGASPFQHASLLVSAPYNSIVTVSYFDHATGTESVKVTKTIAAKQSAIIPIDLSLA